MQTFNRPLFFCALASLLLGIAILIANSFYIYQQQWNPLQLTVPFQEDAKNQGKFVAQLKQRYEVELEFSATLPEKELIALLTKEQGIPSFAIHWQVFSKEKLIAQGNSDNRLYYSTGGRSLLGKIKRLVLGNPFHLGKGSVIRGIGQFNADEGQSYAVQLTVNKVNQRLNVTHPQLNIRPSRLFWQRYSKHRLLLAYTGCALLVLGGGLFVIGILLKLRRGIGEA